MSSWDDVEVLLVEDNASDKEFAVLAFERRHINNKIHVVQDGEEALDFLFCRKKYTTRSAKHKIKVIFLDLKIPKMDGLEVLREIKSDPTTRIIPVVILTSSSEQKDIWESYNLGANSFITKPVDFEDFLKTLGRIGFYWLTINQTTQKS
jgi:two-component system response regulator